jgi:hypothetical protein
MSHVFAISMYPGAPLLSPLLATSEDGFVKSKRSFDVSDSEKVCDGNPVLRRHLIGFLLDLYLAHGRLQSRYGISLFVRIGLAVCFSNEL